MISIVIPHFDKTELTDQLVLSLRKYCGRKVEILVIDDGSKEEYRNKDCTIGRVNDNMGFLYASRTGLSIVGGDIKILINNDVEITGNFIPLVEKQIKSSPLSLVGNELVDWDSGWNTFNGKVFPYLAGYFLAASKEIWDDISFDSRFAPNDFEDVDLSTQAYSLGYPVIALNSPFIKHMGAGTLGYSPEREKLTRRNQEKFFKKWVK
jgi:glycosyltransferase involved in cell wall biosynthesis